MADRVKQLDEKQTELENQIEKFMLALPNLPADDVVAGGKENNQVVKVFGEKPDFQLMRPRTMWICARAWA